MLGLVHDRPTHSASTKVRVTVSSLALSELNLDRTVHSGVDKAVYVHSAMNNAATPPWRDYPQWSDVARLDRERPQRHVRTAFPLHADKASGAQSVEMK